MRFILYCICCFLFCLLHTEAVPAAASNSLDLKNDALGGAVHFDYVNVAAPKGILVGLCAKPNWKTQPEITKQATPWKKFAAANGLLFVQVSVDSTTRDNQFLNNANPDNVDDLVAKGLAQINTSQLPVLGICLDHAENEYLVQIAQDKKDLFKALFLRDYDVNDGANTWPVFKDQTNTIALVASDVESVYHGDATAFANSLASNTSRVALINAIPQDKDAVTNFAQTFLLSTLSADSAGVWCDPALQGRERQPAFEFECDLAAEN